MNRVFITIIGLLFLVSCDAGTEWSDGAYAVYWLETHENRALGLAIDDGTYRGRVQPEVVAIGFNDEVVVAKRRDQEDGSTSYYIVDRRLDSKYLNADEITEGPLTEEAYTELRKIRSLPGLTVTF